ncbi:hypothetical protein NEUTE1DRAFT_110244 [Neurospora tetrasperma FGSC 2508]|uniref:Uncharacterized protein n=1 Tax=Neurospora tetrasperma (strain FGSC 2508 / ATCC MYA-4615 / P0657) TaxID=510951 RepID=F8MNC6_NEUT8|nr:uncharacterized protein NEUTE1DRAFT_110244 [Neurospora tetrasperma FGSC 2508]EGO58096.1 hypothetical protein NEUTE1DRAFT_110244 [Neurospora tetrasperma FGSC 2508]
MPVLYTFSKGNEMDAIVQTRLSDHQRPLNAKQRRKKITGLSIKSNFSLPMVRSDVPSHLNQLSYCSKLVDHDPDYRTPPPTSQTPRALSKRVSPQCPCLIFPFPHVEIGVLVPARSINVDNRTEFERRLDCRKKGRRVMCISSRITDLLRGKRGKRTVSKVPYLDSIVPRYGRDIVKCGVEMYVCWQDRAGQTGTG